MSLGKIIKKIEEKLTEEHTLREEIQTDMRQALRLSKKAIFTIHKGRLDEAQREIENARVIFVNTKNQIESSRNILCMGIINQALEEYAEAQILFNLVKKDRNFVSYEEIGVPITSYILGLADVIGEIRRRTLDLLRRGESQKAAQCLDIMEMIYIEIMGFDEGNFLISGLRRKCDVARHVIEATRGDVILDTRRSQLEESINELKNIIDNSCQT